MTSVRTVRAPVGTGPVVRILSRSNAVEVTTSGDESVRVNGVDAVASEDGTYLLSLRGSARTQVQCPESSQLSICTSSGRVSVRGHVDRVQVLSASGAVDIERAGDAEVRTASGRVAIESCDHDCRVTTQSGRVQVGSCAHAAVSTATGRVEVGHTARAMVRTVSGRVDVGAAADGEVAAETMSGAVEVTIPAGSAARMDLSSRSGRIHRDVVDGEGAAIAVRSASGSIRVRSS